MRVQLIRIGNSRGIRIPKRILEECKVEKEMELTIENDEIRLRPVHGKPREGWEEAIRALQQRHGEAPLDQEWLDADLVDDAGEDAW